MKRLQAYFAKTTVEDLWDHHTAAMRAYGFDRLLYAFSAFRGHGMYDNPQDALLLSNMNPDYIEAYVNGGLFRDGPMSRWASDNHGAASWRDIHQKLLATRAPTADERAVMALNQRHDLRAGYTISFPMAIKNATFPMAIKNATAGIGMAVCADMTQDDADAIWAEHGTEIEVINHVSHLCLMHLPASGQRRLLTARQAEVLELVADGKTMQDIALLLDRNVATVEKHLRGARDALGVETTAQALRKASILNQFFRLDAENAPAASG